MPDRPQRVTVRPCRRPNAVRGAAGRCSSNTERHLPATRDGRACGRHPERGGPAATRYTRFVLWRGQGARDGLFKAAAPACGGACVLGRPVSTSMSPLGKDNSRMPPGTTPTPKHDTLTRRADGEWPRWSMPPVGQPHTSYRRSAPSSIGAATWSNASSTGSGTPVQSPPASNSSSPACLKGGVG